MSNSDKPSLAMLMAQVSPALKDLIQGMLDADPNRRLTIAQVKAHPWFQGPQATLEEAKAHIDAWME
jgi:serine/threonine protein kinase